MKINSKIKYAGVAAAALLAVAPIAAPAITAGNQVATTVQAADTTDASKINGTFNATIANQINKENLTSITIKDNTVTSYETYKSGKTTSHEFEANDFTSVTLSNPITLYYNKDVDRVLNTKLVANQLTLTSDGSIDKASGVNWAATSINDLNATPVSYFEDTTLVDGWTLVTAKATDGATIYSDNTFTTPTSNKLDEGSNAKVLAYVRPTSTDDTKLLGFKIGENQYVKVDDVNHSNINLTNYVESGAVKTTTNTPIYKNANLTVSTGDNYAKGQTVNYIKVARTADGTDYAYQIANEEWIDAKDTEAVETDTNDDLAISTVPANSLNVNSDKKAVVVYNDAATTKKSGSTLSTDYTLWAVTRVAKDADGKTVAYDLGENQWVKASDVTLEDDTDTNEDVKVSNTVSGDALYSNYKAATIYSDPAATKPLRTLSTSYNEWSAFKVSKDNNGKVIAYDLGGGQWVKASDLVRQVDLNGTFYTTAGTPLTNVKGEKTGTIASTGSYQIFAVRYIDGKQSLKLGNDSQWIVAANGDYYPA